MLQTKTEPLFQAKSEPMEYFSDGESKHVMTTSPHTSIDNSVEGHSGYSLQGNRLVIDNS